MAAAASVLLLGIPFMRPEPRGFGLPRWNGMPPVYAIFAHFATLVSFTDEQTLASAALSGDTAMQAAYLSCDPYLDFARQAGVVPPDATARTHPIQRELFKQCVLGVQYGMETSGLARRAPCDHQLRRQRHRHQFHGQRDKLAIAGKLQNPDRDKLDNGRGASQLQSGASLLERAIHFDTAPLFVHIKGP
jgi:hypothetical protein